VIISAFAATLFLTGYNDVARHILNQFKWGSSFEHINRELFEMYSKCENSSEIVKAQQNYIYDIQQSKSALNQMKSLALTNQNPSDESSQNNTNDSLDHHYNRSSNNTDNDIEHNNKRENSYESDSDSLPPIDENPNHKMNYLSSAKHQWKRAKSIDNLNDSE